MNLKGDLIVTEQVVLFNCNDERDGCEVLLHWRPSGWEIDREKGFFVCDRHWEEYERC